MQHRNQEEQPQSNPIKDAVAGQVKKKVRKIASKAAKKLAKLAVKAVKSALMALGKAILGLVGTVGLPAILIAIGVVILIVVLMMVSSMALGGDGNDLDGDIKEIHNKIVEQANNSVDMSKSEQARYRVPEGLIGAVIQIDSLQKEESDYEALINDMATALRPDFTYEEFNEYENIETTVCEDDVCGAPRLETIDHWVSKLTAVDFWNGYTTIVYQPYLTEWRTTTDIKYRTETRTEIKKVKKTIIEKRIEWVLQLVEKTKQEAYDVWVYEPYLDDQGNLACCISKKTTKYRTVVYYEEELVPREVEYEKEIEEEIEVEVEYTVEIKTITRKRRQLFNANESTTEDYAKFDNILNSYNMGKQDKLLIDALFEASGGVSNYTAWLDSFGGGSFGSGFNGTIVPGSNVPPQFMPIYLEVEKKYGVDWYVIAALHFTETGYSTHPTMLSSAGAVGHFQFLPKTWVGWGYPGTITNDILVNLNVINRYKGYGVDAKNSGKADPWVIEDAAHAAGKYLSQHGYSSDPRKAVYAYNHAEWYVDKVLTKAEEIRTQAIYQPVSGMPPVTPGLYMAPTTGAITSGFGPRWGTSHNGIDIGLGGRSNVPVVSIADGVVSNSYYSKSYGNCVVIRHVLDGVQYESLYAHLANRTVQTGQTVAKGQFIGYMGNTGYSTGPHLHFELHQPEWNNAKSNAFNPLANNKGIVIQIPGS